MSTEENYLEVSMIGLTRSHLAINSCLQIIRRTVSETVVDHCAGDTGMTVTHVRVVRDVRVIQRDIIIGRRDLPLYNSHSDIKIYEMNVYLSGSFFFPTFGSDPCCLRDGVGGFSKDKRKRILRVY